ncbi:MAG: universal stress protein [Pseudomonadota bacterium]
MTKVTGDHGFQRVLVVCEDDGDHVGLKHAAMIYDAARRDGLPTSLIEVLSVVEPQPGEDFIQTLGGASQDRLEEIRRDDRRAHVAQALLDAGLPHSTPATVVSGKGFVEIIRHSIAMRADLVIKPAAQVNGLHAHIFGSTDLHLLRKCPCPVWVVRAFPDAGPELGTSAGDAPKPAATPLVVAAVDFDRDADAVGDASQDALNSSIVEAAISIAQASSAALTFVHTWQAPAEGLLQRAAPGVSSTELAQYVREVERWHHAALDTFVSGVRRDAGTKVAHISSALLQGDADEAIAQYVNERRPLTLVMGTIGRTGIPGVIIGNTAEDILIAIDGSVLAVKPPGFESPIRLG